MSYVTLSSSLASLMVLARSMPIEQAKPTRKQIWADLRAQFGIPATIKLAVTPDDATRIVRNKATGNALTIGANGKHNGEVPLPVQTPAQAVPAADTRVAYTFIPRAALNTLQGSLQQRADVGAVAWDDEANGLLLRR